MHVREGDVIRGINKVPKRVFTTRNFFSVVVKMRTSLLTADGNKTCLYPIKKRNTIFNFALKVVMK